MYLKSYSHLVPTIDCGDYFAIEGISRDCNFNAKYISRNKNFFRSIEAKNGLAIIYCGPEMTSSEGSSGLIINKVPQVHAQRYANAVRNSRVDYVERESSACASALVGMAKAKKLIDSNEFKDVLVIGDERISEQTVKVFIDMNIDVKAGDGFSAMHFTKNPPKDSYIKVSDTGIGFSYHPNPWLVSEEGYRKVIKTKDYECIKPHGTGTDVNEEAEAPFCKDKRVIVSPEGLKYKEKYGHMQGASAGVEICQMLHENDSLPRTLCLAAGLGNFYAGLVIEKKA
jgi:hypothetical protein